ncbi:MAG: arginine repressor [Eubacteriales bacterium]
MKSKRHDKIIEIIGRYDIETQDELIEKLKENGYDVTQATVSRDIKELKLVKAASEGSGYKYAVSVREDVKVSAKFTSIIAETVTSIDYAENLVVVKTFAGMAQAAAAAVDGMGWSEVVGSIAGDDTILIVMRSSDKALDITEKIKEIIKQRKK